MTLAKSCITKTIRFGFEVFDWGWDMKLVTGLLAAVLLLAGVASSHAVVRIADDRGGRIGTYVDKYQGLRTTGETVIIDGLCASACTIVLGAVPHDKICVTTHANLGFHAAWKPRLACDVTQILSCGTAPRTMVQAEAQRPSMMTCSPDERRP